MLQSPICLAKQIYQADSLKIALLPVDIGPEKITNEVHLYPNPARDILFIDSEYEIDRLQVVDISGRIIDVLEPEQRRFSIPINDYKFGVYFIRGTTEYGEFVKKFVKQ